MGSPMRQPLDESGPKASSGLAPSSDLAKTRDEVLKVQTITATSAARMITPGIQMLFWLGCMAFSLRARGNHAARASHHSENVQASIPCRVFGGRGGIGRRRSVLLRLAFRDCSQHPRRLQVFAVF